MHWIESEVSELHSFVVRIWLEERASETGAATWRGHVTHIPSGRRQHFDDVREVQELIVPYLTGTNVQGDRPRRGPPGWQQHDERSLADHEAVDRSPDEPYGGRGVRVGGGRSMISWEWTFDTKASDGTKIPQLKDTLTIENVGQTDVTIPPLSRRNISAGIGGDLKCVQFIAIHWAKDKDAAPAPAQPVAPQPYGPPKRVLYSLDGGATWTRLETAHFIMGSGLINQLKQNPLNLCIANEYENAVRIVVVVARNVDFCCEKYAKCPDYTKIKDDCGKCNVQCIDPDPYPTTTTATTTTTPAPTTTKPGTYPTGPGGQPSGPGQPPWPPGQQGPGGQQTSPPHNHPQPGGQDQGQYDQGQPGQQQYGQPAPQPGGGQGTGTAGGAGGQILPPTGGG